jgi:phage shock protein A
LNNRRTQFLVDLTALELDGQIDAIVNQAETDFKRRVLNGEPPAQVRRSLIQDVKGFSNPNYTGNFVGIKKKVHRMIADQEQRMVAKPVEDFKGERGQLYLWVRDPFASGCGDCLRHGKMPPRTKEGWLQLGRGLPRWGDTECNIGCKCMLRPVQRGQKVGTVSNKLYREKNLEQRAEILGVNDIRMQKHITNLGKVRPQSTSYVDKNGRVVAVGVPPVPKTQEQLRTEARLSREKTADDGRVVRKQAGKVAKQSSTERTMMEDSKVLKDQRIQADSGINESRILSNGVKGIFKGRKGEHTGALRQGITQGKQYKREVASSIFDEELGLGLVPITVVKKYKGDVGSFQLWKDGYLKVNKMKAQLGLTGGQWRRHVSDRSREGWYMFDTIQQNQDRHDGNWLAKPIRKKVKKKIDPRPEITKAIKEQETALVDHNKHLEIMINNEKSGKVFIRKLKKSEKEWKIKIEDAVVNRPDRIATYQYELKSVQSRISGQENNLKHRKSDVLDAKMDVAKTKRQIKKLETKLKKSPAQITVTVEEIEIRIALIDNGLSHGTTHSNYQRMQRDMTKEFSGQKVSDYWHGKLKTMKQNEVKIRLRQSQEAGLSQHTIDVFWERVDKVLSTQVHLNGTNFKKGFESSDLAEGGKIGKRYGIGKGS